MSAADVARENRELHRLREIEKVARVIAHASSGFTPAEQAIARYILRGGEVAE